MARARRRDQAAVTHQFAPCKEDAAQGTGSVAINTTSRPKRAKRRTRNGRMPDAGT
ncbi:MAG: hypothetical protein KDI22_06610 [Gammaproteobacteria bacterium]|nr:hypothetical protein [Gammaproteobacteria bacterium]MCB1818816.1 hypothetical protein [Gammaproteobacteria bacterium]MCW5587148.1 hypothetical protein [Chromatiales bacterium]